MKDGHDVRRVTGEIDTLRGELGQLVAELDRRRHELFDLGAQARRHPILVAAVAASAALVFGGLLAIAVRSRRQARRPAVRARKARAALARLMDHPDRVAAEPNMATKILTAVGTVAATTIAKRLVDRYVTAEPRTRRPAAVSRGVAGEHVRR